MHARQDWVEGAVAAPGGRLTKTGEEEAAGESLPEDRFWVEHGRTSRSWPEKKARVGGAGRDMTVGG